MLLQKTELAIIGGTGLTSLANLEITHSDVVDTPWGNPSGPLVYGTLGDCAIVFLSRHGPEHSIPPHRVNYRANIWALREAGVCNIIAVAAVGGIHNTMHAGQLVIPDQLVDYTYSRKHTFFEQEPGPVTHIDFTEPYCAEVREALINAAARTEIETLQRGVYGATQGPRLETAAEIDRMERDGCDIVGMTGMPEASLARELDLCYACCAVIANLAAGRGKGGISMEEIEQNLESGMQSVRKLLEITIPGINSTRR